MPAFFVSLCLCVLVFPHMSFDLLLLLYNLALMQRIAMALALWLLPVSLCAQWLDFRTPGIPRNADGKPNLTASAPRTPDGKPDFSGLWRPEINPYRFDLIQD